MSLINDALRRKNEGKNEPAPEKSDGSPMQPVQPSADKASSLRAILMLLIVMVLLAAALLFWKGLQTKKELAAAAKVQTPPPAPAIVTSAAKDVVQPTPVASPQTNASPAATTEPTNPATADSISATNPVVPTTPPGPPPLKLQGIFYRPSNPTAMINGKTVGVGEIASKARVIKIERQEVTVERDGKIEILVLE